MDVKDLRDLRAKKNRTIHIFSAEGSTETKSGGSLDFPQKTIPIIQRYALDDVFWMIRWLQDVQNFCTICTDNDLNLLITI